MRFAWLIAACALVLAACSSATQRTDAQDQVAVVQTTRVNVIGVAVTAWQQASTIGEAHAAAEVALNLVVGPGGPNYGDADGDGSIGGETVAGLLPGLDGESGLAQLEPISKCVEATVLGGSWADPAGRWAEASGALADWSPANNTMPSLASHPQRIYGWASLTLATDDLTQAHEYGGHAQLHVTVTLAAFEDCG